MKSLERPTVLGARQPGKVIPIGEIQKAGSVGSGRPGERRLRLVRPAAPEPALQSPLGRELNDYLNERARLRAAGELQPDIDDPPISTPADAISLDLSEYKLEIDRRDEDNAKYWSVDRIMFAFNYFAFGKLSQAVQRNVTAYYELRRDDGLTTAKRNEESGRLNGEESAIVTQLLHRAGLPFTLPHEGITIPFAVTVTKMREIAGGEPLFPNPTPPNVTYIASHRRNR